MHPPSSRFFSSLFLLVAVATSSCSSCEPPREPVVPADISGRWVGGYTLYDGSGRPLTDSMWVTIRSNDGNVSGEGVRKRILQDAPPMESPIEVEGSVVVNTFRIELVDPATRNRAVFSGKIEGDTLSGPLSVDGMVMGNLRMVASRE